MGNYPETFTFLQIHLSDDYWTPWGNTRAFGYYGVQYVPTAWFEGLTYYIGSSNAYAIYESNYLSRLAVASDLTLTLGAKESLLPQMYEVHLRISNRSADSAHTVRVQIAQVLDHYPTSDTKHRNCFRQAATAQEITLTPDEATELTTTFTVEDDDWAQQEDIKFIAWVEDTGATAPQRIHNATFLTWPFVPLPETGDLNCDGAVDGFDIDSFVLVLSDVAPYDGYYAQYTDCDHTLADVNSDGAVDGFDIDPFVDLIGGR